jgi:Pyruvate-formate lyase-activating enzyme
MELIRITTTTENETMHCNACQWRCTLQPGDTGRCLVRVGSAQGITAQNYGLISAASVAPIEDYRLWHFFPDSLVLAIGSWGYAFPVDQQRGAYARIPTLEAKRRRLSPERAASFALERLCRGVIWVYSEPAVAHEYVLRLLQTSRATSRYTALVTTGYLTAEILDSFGPYLDGISLDLRGFGDTAYARLAGIPDWRGILGVMAWARQHWRCHIEVTTRLHHGVNDDPRELRALVDWIHNALGEQTPWHVLPGDAGAETAAAVVRARRIGHEGGLQFVYGPEPNQNTICPVCQAVLITRDNGLVSQVGISDGACANCGHRLYVRTSIFKR